MIFPMSKETQKFILEVINYLHQRGCIFYISDHALCKNPVIGMNIASTADISDGAVLAYIQTYNNNNTR